MRENIDILAIGPHPDDIEMGCGGTLVRMRKNGYSTGVIDLTRGEMGTRGSKEIRDQETEAGLKVLGLSHRSNLNIPDGQVWNNDENREKVVRAIRELRPRQVLMSYWEDDHPDHIQAAHLVRDAFYMSGFKKFCEEVPFYRPQSLMFYMVRREFEPTVIVDITDDFEEKMEAVRAYGSQFFSKDSKDADTVLSQPDFLEMFTVRALYYGRLAGVKYGEPFFAQNPPVVKDTLSIV